MLDKEKNPGSGLDIEQGTFNRKKVDFVSRRVVVQLKGGDTAQDLDALAEELLSVKEGTRVLRGMSATGRLVLLLPPGESVPSACRSFAAIDAVEYAEPDLVDQPQLIPTDPRYPMQWAPPLVNAEQAWDLTTGSSGVLIGIIDSGVSMTAGVPDHPDLGAPGRFILGTDFIDGGPPDDTGGHGTHVAGIAAAIGNNGAGIAGMNWSSPIYVCRTFGPGGGSHADLADALEEITDYAVANGLRAVINYSGGGSDSLTKRNACQYASDRGALVIAATGNDNGGPVIFPAAYSTTITGVVAVGSTDSDDTVSSFSNVGPEVTVVAPGGSIQSTLPTYATPGNPTNYGNKSGTSMATPLVTGVASLIWSRHPGYSNQKVKQCLIDTAVKLGSGNFNNSWGYGRVDAYQAVRCGSIFPGPFSRVVLCHGPSVLRLCPTPSVLVVKCPSKLPLLCPIKSKLILCEQPSVIGCQSALTACPSKLACPSLVDGCPSTPGGCFDPGVIDPGVIDPGRLTGGIRAFRMPGRALSNTMEEWSRVLEEPEVGEEGWFYLDDEGNAHRV